MQIKFIKISDKLKEEIVRYAISFFFAWLSSALISDFPFFKDLIIKSGLVDFFNRMYLSFTENTLHLIGLQTFTDNNTIKIIGSPGIRLVYGCLGFRHLTFFIIFIALQFGKTMHKLYYLIAGIGLLILINMFRITLIAFTQFKEPSMAQQMHDIASPMLMYPTILFLWIFWVVKFGKPNEKSFLILPRIKKTSAIFRLRKK